MSGVQSNPEQSQEIVVWQDISKQLFNLVRSVLNRTDGEMSESTIRDLIQPYLKQIEADLTKRLNQEREDANKEWMVKYDKRCEDQSRSRFLGELEDCGTLIVGEQRVSCSLVNHWSAHIPMLARLNPQFAELAVRRRPPTERDYAAIWKLQDKPQMDKYMDYRASIELLNCDPSLADAFTTNQHWQGVVLDCSLRGVPMLLGDVTRLIGRDPQHNALYSALRRLQPMLAQRSLRANDLRHFIMQSSEQEYEDVTLGELAEVLKSCSEKTNTDPLQKLLPH